MPGLHAGAEMSGPLMMLGAGNDASQPMSPEKAAQGVVYWQGTAERLLADSNIQGSATAREGWAELAVAQAGLLAANSRTAEAESVFKSAATIAPASFLPVERWAQWLARSGRSSDAVSMVQQFAGAHPDQIQAAVSLLARLGVSP